METGSGKGTGASSRFLQRSPGVYEDSRTGSIHCTKEGARLLFEKETGKVLPDLPKAFTICFDRRGAHWFLGFGALRKPLSVAVSNFLALNKLWIPIRSRERRPDGRPGRFGPAFGRMARTPFGENVSADRRRIDTLRVADAIPRLRSTLQVWRDKMKETALLADRYEFGCEESHAVWRAERAMDEGKAPEEVCSDSWPAYRTSLSPDWPQWVGCILKDLERTERNMEWMVREYRDAPKTGRPSKFARVDLWDGLVQAGLTMKQVVLASIWYEVDDLTKYSININDTHGTRVPACDVDRAARAFQKAADRWRRRRAALIADAQRRASSGPER